MLNSHFYIFPHKLVLCTWDLSFRVAKSPFKNTLHWSITYVGICAHISGLNFCQNRRGKGDLGFSVKGMSCTLYKYLNLTVTVFSSLTRQIFSEKERFLSRSTMMPLINISDLEILLLRHPFMTQISVTIYDCACSVASVVTNSLYLWTVACQASLSMGFSRREYWSGLLCPPPGDLPDPGINPLFPAL